MKSLGKFTAYIFGSYCFNFRSPFCPLYDLFYYVILLPWGNIVISFESHPYSRVSVYPCRRPV
jgi:hypothetical protein